MFFWFFTASFNSSGILFQNHLCDIRWQWPRPRVALGRDKCGNSQCLGQIGQPWHVRMESGSAAWGEQRGWQVAGLPPRGPPTERAGVSSTPLPGPGPGVGLSLTRDTGDWSLQKAWHGATCLFRPNNSVPLFLINFKNLHFICTI